MTNERCSITPFDPPPQEEPMRSLALVVGLMLLVGVYALVSGSAAAPAAAPEGPGSTEFGFALAAGAIAMAATLLVSRPRMRFRR